MEGFDAKISIEEQSIEESGNTQMKNSSNLGNFYDYELKSMSALEILRETVRILRFNCAAFMSIAALLICPVSAVQLSNLFVDHNIVRRLSVRLLLIARTSGLPLNSVVKQSCLRFSEMSVANAVCFPLYVTLSLLSKAAVVYSVDSTYSKKQFDASKFCVVAKKLWRRVFVTYVWSCMAIVGVVTLFLILLVALCNVFVTLGFTFDLIVYPGMVVGLIFSIVFANAIIICNVAIVVSVLEDASGLQALLRSRVLIKGQTQVGLLMYLMTTIGLAFVQGLFEHRVKTLSYGDGSSRIWEGPLLVLMYSFVVLVDSMMTSVYYFSCRSFSQEEADEESQPIIEMGTAIPKITSDQCDDDVA
ncbi:hypothetical protein RND81_02G217000 [Saponaria officinalis]|uniref:Son of sevenless n=1 Tax=Saponaria officinalis TaxID=3572 RepID=A0AAW1MXD5_SAPOF